MISQEFLQYRMPESLIISLNTLKLMLKALPASQTHHIRLVDGGFEKAIAQIRTLPGNHREVLILRAVNASIPHYFTLFIEKNEDRMQCILLDASNCQEHFASILKKLAAHFEHILVAVGHQQLRKLQNDTKSCILFAFEHAVLLSQAENPFAMFEGIPITDLPMLEKHSTTYQLDEEQVAGIKKTEILDDCLTSLHLIRWVDMPFHYVKHMQTVTGIDHYISESCIATNRESMVQHKPIHVRRRTLLDSTRVSNCSLLDRSIEIESSIKNFLAESTDDLQLLKITGVAQEMRPLLEALSIIFDRIPAGQYIEIYHFLFSDQPLSKKEILQLNEKVKMLSNHEQALKVIENNQLKLLNLVSHPRFKAVISSGSLLTLLEKGLIQDSQLSYIRSEKQLQQLNSQELLAAIANQEVSFGDFVQTKDFDLAEYKSLKENVRPADDESCTYLGSWYPS
jgi:hypothetical protein